MAKKLSTQTPSRGGALLMVAAAAAALLSTAGFVRAAGMAWNDQTRRLELSGPEGRPWLVDGVARIALTDGPVITTGDERFRVAVAEHHGRWVVTGVDSEKTVDWEMVVRSEGPHSVRLDWTIYNRGVKPLTLDRLDVLAGKLAGKADPANNHVLTSGENSWSGGRVARLEKKANIESYYTLAVQTPPLAAGFLAGRHNLDRLRLARDADGLQLTAYGPCDRCVLPAGASRSADPLFLAGGGHPLGQMEHFADLAAEENGVQPWPENFATWCSWYAGWMREEPLYKYKGGLETGVETNIPLVAKHFGARGAASMRIVDDSYEMAYGDWDDRTLAISHGFGRLARKMKDAGIRPGVWYPPFWVSTKSRLFREHPEMLCRDDTGEVFVEKSGVAGAYGNFFAYLDASNPAAEEQIEKTARAWRDRGFRYVMTDFLKWGAWSRRRFDPTLTAVEAHNRGLAAMRRGYGKDTYWLHCGALLGPAMGLCDGMRISGDSHGGAIYSYVSAGARWFYNWRVWINDPDAIVCAGRGEPKSVPWNRTWMSWMALAGAVVTYGDTLDDLSPDYLELYRRVLPPLRMAGRPLDLWENEPFLLWGIDPGQADGPYTLLGVFEFQGRRPGQTITLNLDEAAARSRSWTETPKQAPARWLLWDFWRQKLTKVDGPTLTIDIPSKSCCIFSLRPCLGRPQLVGTSGHISQGALETQQIRWDPRRRYLTGKVRGNGGDPTTLFFHVPEAMECVEAFCNYKKLTPGQVEPNVLAIDVPAVSNDPVSFELHFSGTAQPLAARPFASGPVGRVQAK